MRSGVLRYLLIGGVQQVINGDSLPQTMIESALASGQSTPEVHLNLCEERGDDCKEERRER